MLWSEAALVVGTDPLVPVAFRIFVSFFDLEKPSGDTAHSPRIAQSPEPFDAGRASLDSTGGAAP
jgi:hypothetical protein